MSSVLTDKHPCFSAQAKCQYACMHLPVASRCNISCNYCSRKFDCANESRPGVTSKVLSPLEACEKFKHAKAKIPNLSVVGIAGPGDALANWDETRETIELIKQADPHSTICLSTNGLLLPEYASALIRLGVKNVTVTVNCTEADVGAQIYGTVSYRGKRYVGKQGAKILLSNQQEGIMYLAGHGVNVKVNIAMIKLVNDWHIADIVKQVRKLGACITNIMPCIAAPGSVLDGLPQTTMQEVTAVRAVCANELNQMSHCRQCPTDAGGFLEQDRVDELRSYAKRTELVEPKPVPFTDRYNVAITTKFGKLVDLPLNQAEEFYIYQVDGSRYEFMEMRRLGKNYTVNETIQVALSDCDAVLTMHIDYQTQRRLLKQGIMPVEYCYTIESGLCYAVEQLELKRALHNKLRKT